MWKPNADLYDDIVGRRGSTQGTNSTIDIVGRTNGIHPTGATNWADPDLASNGRPDMSAWGNVAGVGDAFLDYDQPGRALKAANDGENVAVNLGRVPKPPVVE